MKCASIDGASPPAHDRGDMVHPILGNYHLPVEVENTRKQSGMHNLSREGWGEDMPRNFPYKDGLRILHPRLQERFGDENVDLALGVLEELIEVEEQPPFPASVFQRWKHEHLRRKTSPPGSAIEPTGPIGTSSKYSTPTRSFMSNAKKELGHRVMSALSETRESLSYAASDRVELIEIGRYEKLPNDTVPTTFVASKSIGGQGATRKVSNIMNVNLPPGRDIPNANFARKNELIQVGQPTPDYLLALRQPTLDEVVDRLWESKIKCPDSNPLRSYLNNYYSLPASPSVFFDGGLDYKWDTPDIIESTENDVSNIYSASGIDELLQSTHFTYEDSHNITDDCQLENTYHAHTTDCVEQFGLSKLSTSNSHNTKLFEDKEEEILYPTVYVPPAKGRISKKENRKGSSALKSEPYQIEREHHDRDRCGGICQSWECRYKQEYRKSMGNVVKWSEPSSRYGEESEESEESRLSPTVYSPPSSLDPFNKYKSSPHSTKLSWGENNISPHFVVDCLETCDAGTATSHKPTFPKEENLGVTVPQLNSQLSMSLEEVNLTPPGRLSERSYLPKIPIRSESPAAFGRPKAGSPKNSISLTTEFPLSLKSQTNVNQYNTTNGDSTIPYFLRYPDDSPLPASPVIASNPVRKGIMDLDGAVDVCFPKQTDRTKQPILDNKPKTPHNIPNSHNGHSLYNENNLGEAAKRFLMELNQGRLPTLQSPTICSPQPLYICKQPSQVQLEQATKHQNHNTSNEKAGFPPRSSSIPKRECSGSIEQARPFLFDQEVAIREPKSQLNDPKISISRSTKISQMSSDQPNTPGTAERSTVSEIKQYYFSGSSSGLLGDFIPIGTPGSVYSPPPQQQLPLKTIPANSSAYGHKTENSRNPYAFEPETPLNMDESPQTTMTDFMHIYDDVRPASSPILGIGHVKNSRSVGHTTNRSDLLAAPQYLSHGHGLQRSGTSPSVTPSRFVAREEFPNPKHRAYYDDVDSISPILNNAYPTQSLPHRGRAATFGHSRIPLRKGSQEQFQQPSRSPARKPSGGHRVQPSHTSDEAGPDGRGRSATYTPIRKEINSNYSNESYSSSASTTINRQMTRSPAKNLIGVTEQDETNSESPDLLPMSPKKRSRSPMKKMFGEHGWLGSSPNEVIPSILSSKSATQKMDKPRKPGMMEKIKNKIEGFTEKADMKNDKNRISVLSISINPYEQARYLVELELMIVHTANTFLMIQFSQGRMSIDSIKKTVDTWKNKGRPAVVEFMYDQGTQRDLVTANQYNFRFHGNRLGDDVRISSMLYNWKQVASLMSIRTFCNADTVLLKLVFDVEQILELIGGSEQIMLRLQHLRLSINEAIRIAKVDRATRTSPNGRDRQWESHSPPGISHNDSYGGMKLVPERYLG
ncbi:hypothetical protein SS1G_09581 [Sclerotinia sclerotiorum 1980 UF-70]|uniref:Uncharacterized protein n=1 Tax=Sclerotinia sclerotiorum (strain ATCC 18683 / 1980 / Ss-1) TaxID=665079 RepID=A7EW72_SCLS1|nr:hypothetical protein SS1G_09581 [Sclerotinia sclerotiorum 1980 UF-70]EDN93714.1 hypothetical protein SS1G_09581 [Sclerotinia sclerotiorum 1980 UF-70]